MTPAQAGFWAKLRRHDSAIPESFTAGDYRCPGHNDQRASLSVDYKGNRVLFHCQADCTPEAVRRRLGIAWVDLDDYGPAIGKKHIASYTYTDAAGVPELRVDRYEPKDFRVLRFEDGQWVYGRGKIPYRLYRLPRVAEAVATGERVWLVEGEKDADALERAGVAATTTPGGAGKTWRPEYTEALRGAYVTIVADRDEAGRKHARTAYAALREAAAEVVLVEPAVNRPHADASDHLEAGLGLDDFAPLNPLDPGEATDTAPERPLPVVAREDGGTILEEIEQTYRRFVVFPSDHEAVALALWTAHTWAIRAADTTPYVQVKAPEHECGKSRVGEVAACLAAHPWAQVDATEAALFRKLAADPPPTVILDEIDVFGDDGDDRRSALRATLNAGYRRGLSVPRVEQRPTGFEVVEYPVFGAKMLIGIGRLPGTLQSRVVPIRMQRKAKHERVERFSIIRTPPTLEDLRDRLHAWAELVAGELRAALPELPEALSDRQQDVWEPLFALADAAAGDWPKRARAAAVALHERDPAADPAMGPLLLGHILEAFAIRGDDGKATSWRADELATETLLKHLVGQDAGPWAEWWGKAVKDGETKGPGAKLAKVLRPYGIKPEQLKIDGEKTRGYKRAEFADAWGRYLPPGTVPEDGTTVPRRSEALFDPDASEADIAAEQDGTEVPSSNTVPGRWAP